jgi:hypothetical protein
VTDLHDGHAGIGEVKDGFACAFENRLGQYRWPWVEIENVSHKLFSSSVKIKVFYIPNAQSWQR